MIIGSQVFVVVIYGCPLQVGGRKARRLSSKLCLLMNCGVMNSFSLVICIVKLYSSFDTFYDGNF